MIVNKIPTDFLHKVFWMQNQIQYNHWKESVSGWQHEVLGDYYQKLNKHIDILVEGVAAIFGRDSLTVSDAGFIIMDYEENKELVIEINKIFLEFRKNLESENGLVNTIDDILKLNNSTIYKLGLR